MFEPWLERDYGDPENALRGRQLMIVGESHYSKDPSEAGTAPEGFTTGVVDYLALKKRHQFFGKVQEIVTGEPRRDQTAADRAAFWHSVVFYNYVRELVDGRSFADGGARRRPSEEMFRRGAEPFREIRRRFEPHVVIICGLETWRYLAPTIGILESSRDILFFDDGTSLYGRIQHPSWPGFDTRKWHGRIRSLMDQAERPRVRGWHERWKG